MMKVMENPGCRISQHYKANRQQTHSQYQTKQRKPQSISIKVRNKTRVSTPVILVQYSTYSFCYSNKTTEGVKGNTNWKGKSQSIPVFRWYDSTHKAPKDYTRKLLLLINTFRKVAGYKINMQTSVAFLHITINILRKKQGNNPIHNSFKSHETHPNKFNWGIETLLRWKL